MYEGRNGAEKGGFSVVGTKQWGRSSEKVGTMPIAVAWAVMMTIFLPSVRSNANDDDDEWLVGLMLFGVVAMILLAILPLLLLLLHLLSKPPPLPVIFATVSGSSISFMSIERPNWFLFIICL
jgi:hypothetical protein